MQVERIQSKLHTKTSSKGASPPETILSSQFTKNILSKQQTKQTMCWILRIEMAALPPGPLRFPYTELLPTDPTKTITFIAKQYLQTKFFIQFERTSTISCTKTTFCALHPFYPLNSFKIFR
jgi:hypothetical protein